MWCVGLDLFHLIAIHLNLRKVKYITLHETWWSCGWMTWGNHFITSCKMHAYWRARLCNLAMHPKWNTHHWWIQPWEWNTKRAELFTVYCKSLILWYLLPKMSLFNCHAPSSGSNTSSVCPYLNSSNKPVSDLDLGHKVFRQKIKKINPLLWTNTGSNRRRHSWLQHLFPWIKWL